jgi:diguanylate cyclase (GGDEF)-like protein
MTPARVLEDRGARVPEDRGAMARVFAYLFAAGATLLLLTLALPDTGARDAGGLAGIVIAAYAAAAGFLAFGGRPPIWVFRAAPALGSALVGLAVRFGGSATASAYAACLFWVVLAACYFMPRAVAATHVVLAIAAYGGALLWLGDVPAEALQWSLAAGTLLVAGAVTIALRDRFEAALAGWASAARTDALTGLANRRELEDRFAVEIERSTRGGRPLAVLVLDMDLFRDFNERFGQGAGNAALERAAAALRGATRGTDVVARTGGQEFAVLAPETGPEEAALLAERLLDDVRTAFARDPEQLTISCGLAGFPIHGITPAELLQAADSALREAKRRGRDQAVAQGYADAVAGQMAELAMERTSPRVRSLISLAEAVDRRLGTPGHSGRVARIAERLAEAGGLPGEDVARLRIAALLRDVGEVGVAESILNRPGPLGEDEWRELRQHPEVGARIVGAAQLGDVAEWIHAHHERPDGTGYPRGLHGHQIPLQARVLAVADAYAAMTSLRPHRPALSPRRARAELQAGAGTQFDHEVVERLLEIAGEVDALGAEGQPPESVPASSTK